MRKNLRALTLIEFVAVAGILPVIFGVTVSTLARFRELNKRIVCSINLKGIGAAARIYAQNNFEQWMVPPFLEGNIGDPGIDYVNNGPDIIPWTPTANLDPGAVGWNRDEKSTSATVMHPGAGSGAVSVTRAYWMMVRSGDISVKQFVCPSSGDQADQTANVDLYYDFTGYHNISYAYQVPFGRRDTRPREGMDNRQIVAADKGPFYIFDGPVNFRNAAREPIDLEDSPKEWRPFNSRNHGGRFSGEGQNCLFPDGRVCFHSIPAVGVDNDNVYTLMNDEWGNLNFNRIHGDTVFQSAAEWPYPGQDAFGACETCFASTDTLLYP